MRGIYLDQRLLHLGLHAELRWKTGSVNALHFALLLNIPVKGENGLFWLNVTVHNKTRAMLCPIHERQDAAQTRTGWTESK